MGEVLMSKQVRVKKSEQPESTEILAEAIVNIGKATKKLTDSRLNREAIVILIQAKTKINRATIETVLNSLPQLERWYLNK